MIRYENIKRYNDLAFVDYLKLEGNSNSYLKSEVCGVVPSIVVTDNMKLGSMVDAILTEPSKVDFTSEFYAPAREIAKIIMSDFKDMISQFSKQVNYTADIVYTEGNAEYRMPVKGRLDFSVDFHAAIDLKVTNSTDISSLVNFMGYDDQLWNYSRIAQCKAAFLIVYFRKLKKAKLFQVDVSKDSQFWINKTIKFGNIKILTT